MRVIALSIALLLLLPLPALASQDRAPPGCAAGPLAQAAAALHPDAEVVEVDERGALLLLPLVHPGVRMRLVEVDGVWCDAQRGFNAASTGSALERAKAYAQVAAAPWFDGVTVVDAREVLPGIVHLTTHARTNGVVAEWVVHVDALGIARAQFTAVEFAVAPFDAEIEGLTALPGLTRAFVRAAGGTIEPTVPIVPLVSTPPLPQRISFDRMSDDFLVWYRYGQDIANVYPTMGELTFTTTIQQVTRENYEEFLTWGLTKGWALNEGFVAVDSDLALQCLACVIISQNFQIHIFSGIVPALEALGYSYPNDRLALSTVIGHEMFHNFQNAYSKPAGGVFMDRAYSEGLARFQETLHTYSHVSHQPDSLVYAADANGCNDELGAQGGSPNLADGPSTDQAYSACDFWLTFYGQHGIEGVRGLLEASPRHRAKSGWTEFRDLVQDATGAPIADDLARFAGSLLTGARLTWGPAVGSGPTLDWNEHLRGWSPPTLAPGGSIVQTITDGGMMGARITTDGRVHTTSGLLYVIDASGVPTRIVSGASVHAPAWVVAVQPDVGAAGVVMTLE